MAADGYELWYERSDPTHIYLVAPTSVEAWAPATDWYKCGFLLDSRP